VNTEIRPAPDLNFRPAPAPTVRFRNGPALLTETQIVAGSLAWRHPAPVTGYQVPAGAAAQVALYTEHWHHFAIIRRILLRMKSWMNYVFTEGH